MYMHETLSFFKLLVLLILERDESQFALLGRVNACMSIFLRQNIYIYFLRRMDTRPLFVYVFIFNASLI